MTLFRFISTQKMGTAIAESGKANKLIIIKNAGTEVMSRSFLLILPLTALWGCGPGKHMQLSPLPSQDRNDAQQSGSTGTNALDFLNDALPVFQRRCEGCHNAQSSLPNWLNYDVVLGKKDLILKRFIVDRTMPPPPLHLAVSDGERKVIEEWLRGGAIKAKEKPPTPKAALPAIVNSPAPIAGANTIPDEQPTLSPEILAAAIANGDIEKTKSLLSSGANPNSTLAAQNSGPLAEFAGYPPLLIAIKKGFPGLTAILLGLGADPQIPTNGGETAQKLADKIQIEPYRKAITELLVATQNGGSLSKPSYARDIKPILQNRCVMCHGEQGVPSMNWMKYENASAERLLLYVRAAVIRDMPIGNITAMTEDEREKITSWVKTGGSP